MSDALGVWLPAAGCICQPHADVLDTLWWDCLSMFNNWICLPSAQCGQHPSYLVFFFLSYGIAGVSGHWLAFNLGMFVLPDEGFGVNATKRDVHHCVRACIWLEQEHPRQRPSWGCWSIIRQNYDSWLFAECVGKTNWKAVFLRAFLAVMSKSPIKWFVNVNTATHHKCTTRGITFSSKRGHPCPWQTLIIGG